MPLSQRSKTTVRISVILFLCLIFYLSRARKARHESAYQDSYSFAKISLKSIFNSSRSTPNISFIFFANGIEYYGRDNVPTANRMKILKALEHDVFVVYSPRNPKVYDLLMTKSDLSDYNIAYPDSVLSFVNSIEDIIDEF